MSADTHQDENVQSRSFAKSLERHVKRCNKTSRERTTQSVFQSVLSGHRVSLIIVDRICQSIQSSATA